MPCIRVVFAIILCSLLHGAFPLELTLENWNEKVSGKQVFLKFFAPWCGHCKKLKPDWDKLSSDFDGSPTGLVAKVDCTGRGKPLCQKYEVQAYPTLMWGQADKLEVYTGPRSYEDFRHFAGDRLGPTCGPGNLDLCDDNRRALINKFMRIAPDALDDKIKLAAAQIQRSRQVFMNLENNLTNEITLAENRKQKKIKSIRKRSGVPNVGSEGEQELTPSNWDERAGDRKMFIKFFAPWCGHCKAMKPDWDRLTSDFEGTSTALVGEVDCTGKGKPLCDKHGVDGFPRLLWGTANKLTAYKGSRQYTALRDFADDYLGAKCGPERPDLCEETHLARVKEFAKLSPEDRTAKTTAAEKAVEDAEKAFQDRQWKLLGDIDAAEEKMKKQMQAVTEQGLSEAKLVQAWNRKQPPGFWKPPAHDSESNLVAGAIEAFGITVKASDAVAIIIVVAFALLLLRCQWQRSPKAQKVCQARHILMESEETLLKAKARIEAGEPFHEVAKECSKCGSAQDGGALGKRVCGSMEAPLDAVCFDPGSKIGEVMGPIQTKHGFHLIMLESREGVGEQTCVKGETMKDK